jgi:hypothetical protein
MQVWGARRAAAADEVSDRAIQQARQRPAVLASAARGPRLWLLLRRRRGRSSPQRGFDGGGQVNTRCQALRWRLSQRLSRRELKGRVSLSASAFSWEFGELRLALSCEGVATWCKIYACSGRSGILGRVRTWLPCLNNVVSVPSTAEVAHSAHPPPSDADGIHNLAHSAGVSAIGVAWRGWLDSGVTKWTVAERGPEMLIVSK